MCFILFVLGDVCFVTFPVLFVCICVLNNCHRVATQLQLNISYQIISLYQTNQTNQMQQFFRFIARRLFTAQHVSSIPMPITRSSTTAVAASGLLLERGGCGAVGRGRVGCGESEWSGDDQQHRDHDQLHRYHHVPTVNQRLLLQLLSSW
jgi:hypothetical protein